MDKSTLLAVLGLTFSMSKMTPADDIPPRVFVGNVTLGGEPASPGTGITAMVRGEEKGFVQVYERGEYGPMYVEYPATDCLISFRIDNHMADQTAPGYKTGGIILNLTANTGNP
jgi:hypothetical protein